MDPGQLGGSAVERLPSAQGVIPESWDRIPHQAPCEEPVSPSACVSASLSLSLSLSVFLMNKYIKSLKQSFLKKNEVGRQTQLLPRRIIKLQ